MTVDLLLGGRPCLCFFQLYHHNRIKVVYADLSTLQVLTHIS